MSLVGMVRIVELGCRRLLSTRLYFTTEQRSDTGSLLRTNPLYICFQEFSVFWLMVDVNSWVHRVFPTGVS